MKHKQIILGAFLFLGSLIQAQINTQSAPNETINQQNPFLDASGYISAENNIGKGLYFPQTNLTNWEFKLDLVDPGTFPTYFDGMIVYNSGTGKTIADVSKGGKQVDVTPGFYYFKNPNQSAPRGSVANGEWVRLGSDVTAAVAPTVANIECNEENRGKSNYVQDYTTERGSTFDVYGICLKGSGGYVWRYTYGTGGVSTGKGVFGSGL